METRHRIEPDRLVAQAQAVAVSYRNRIEISVDDMLEECDGCRGTHHLDSRVDLQEFFDASRMIRLSVVDDDIFDIFDRRNLSQRFQIIIGEFRLCALKQSRLFARPFRT